jgi:hypothetical protein
MENQKELKTKAHFQSKILEMGFCLIGGNEK